MDRRDFIRNSTILGASLVGSRYISIGQTKQAEILSKRTFTQKTFDIGSGVRNLEAHIGHIHYRDGALKDGAFSEIDTTLNYNAASQTFQMTAASYEAEIGLYGSIRFTNIDHSIAFELDNPAQVQAMAYDGSAFGKIGKALIWRDILGKGGHQIVEARNGALAKIFRFDSKPASNVITFQVSFGGLARLWRSGVELRPMLAEIRSSDALNIESNGRLSYLRKPTAWNHRGESVPIELRWYRSALRLHVDKIIPQAFIDATFVEANAWLECDTTTSYYAGAHDGMCQRWTFDGNWSASRGSSTSMSVSQYDVYVYTLFSEGSAIGIDRIMMPVDSSGIPDAATISAASLYLCYRPQGEARPRNVCLVQTTQDETNLTVDDYSRLTLNSPDEGATRKAASDWSDDSYSAWALNATGRGWINKTGWTKLGVREEKDVDQSANTPGFAESGLRIYSSAETGTSLDPYLDVTYTEGGTRRKPPMVVTY